MRRRRGSSWLAVVLVSGCAAQGVLPPFPDQWPLAGVEVDPTTELPEGEVVPPGELASAASCGPQAQCDTPLGALPGGPLALTAPPVANPLLVPVANHDAAWESIVNIVDDYFRIAGEERVQVVGQVLTEGRIETFPQVGATILEPHRPDSVGHFNRTLATYQTIRRVALVRVMPAEGGFQIEAIVETQMEDLPRPEHATAGRATFRSDTSLSTDDSNDRQRQPTGVWYPIGRDVALEQQMLAEIRACLDVAPPGVVY